MSLSLPSAEAFASEPNFGVRGFRSIRSEPSSSTTTIQPSAPVVAELTDAEEAEILTKRFDQWNQMRLKQKQDIARKMDWKDAVKFALGLWLLQRAVHAVGLKVRIVAPVLAMLTLVRSIWRNRATTPRYPGSGEVYTNWPIWGQMGIIPDALNLGGNVLQMHVANLRKFASGEVVMFGKPNEFSLMDPNDRRYMLRTNWKNFTKNQADGSGFQEKFAEVMGRGIFAVDGEEWADQRKVASHMFSANGLRLKMERSFTSHGLKTVDLLMRGNHVGKQLDFQDLMANLTFETICDIAFGVSPGSLESGLANGKKIDFLLQFDRAQQYSALRFVFPTPVWKLLRYLNVGSERQLRKDGENLRQYVGNIVRNHQDGDDNMLSLYIRTGKQTGKKFMLEEDYLVDTILNFMIAGRDTTSCLLTNMFKLMTPEVERKMLDELDRVVGRSANVNWDHVRDLQYCSAVFNEVLRLYPPVGFDVRTAVEDDVFPSGLEVKAGENVVFPMVAIGRDPHLFDNPNQFLPERWILDPSKPTNRPDELVFPVFWGGPRLCLGKDMARLEALNVAYSLLKHFTIEVLPHNEKMVIGPVQFYEHGLPVKIHLRKD
ncbi:hypothetical protein BASA81_006300 [Batrachochytrium salamandrivorans]|nr:hypothetical protein BASA81_006300 [Batrachochytrium salamandrivorans]